MLKQDNSENKKLLMIAILSAAISFIFSFMGAPFLRLLALKKAILFWFVGFVFIVTLFFLKIDLIAIYVGAIWMTLALYSRFENQGLSWKKSGVLSVFSGLCFGVIGFLFITKGSQDHQLVKEITEPIVLSFKQFLPNENIEARSVLMIMPSVLASALLSAIAAGLAFESQLFQVFNIKREKTASGLRWLEFRLPDLFIWISLFSFLLSIIETPYKWIQVLAMNISIFSVVAYFFQGITIVEFATRLYRVGRFSKFFLYLLIISWALPFVSLIGITDYWIDFRRIMRKAIKVV